MAWACKDCQYVRYKIEDGKVVCLSCGGLSVLDDRVNSVSVSPVKSSNDTDSDTDQIEKQHSYDKKRKVLRGAAFKSKKEKLVKNLEDIDEGLINTEEFKSNSGVFIHSSKHRSKKAGDIKARVHRDLLSLNRECGYSVNLNCFAPVPKCGKRGEPLSLFLEDCDGRAPKCVCKPYAVVGCSCKAKQLVNVGIQLQKCPEYSDNMSDNDLSQVLTPSNTRKLVARKASGQDVISPIFGQSLSLLDQSVQSSSQHDSVTDQPRQGQGFAYQSVHPVVEQSVSTEQLDHPISVRDPPGLPTSSTSQADHPSSRLNESVHLSEHTVGRVQHDLALCVEQHSAHPVVVPEQFPHAITGPSKLAHPHSSWALPVTHHLHNASKETGHPPHRSKAVQPSQQLPTHKTKMVPGFTPPTIENVPKKGNSYKGQPWM